ncbi:MAG: PD40 domain-containing protein [Planctomycetes bacterium]|nr:PD40 domain-containing protein [Planctomycetota bacterium]
MSVSKTQVTALIAAGGSAALVLGGCMNGPNVEPRTASSRAVMPAGNSGAIVHSAARRFDPFNVALAGDDDGALSMQHGSASERIPLTPSPVEYGHQPVLSASEILGDVLASEKPASDLVRTVGANFSQITFSLEGANFDPNISPDGRKMVFASTRHSFTADIFIKDVSSRVKTQLTNTDAHDMMPKISPDGTRVAFASNRRGNWDIYIMPITGGRAVQITTASSHELHPSWSPDGQHLVFSRLGAVSGRWELWVTNVFNTGMAHYLGDGLFPEWCPVAGTGQNGADQIVFQRSSRRGDRAFSIWTIDYADGQASYLTEIVGSEVAACINPTWSPDGERVAFAAVPNPKQWAEMTKTRPSSANLWMISTNGSGLVNLTSNDVINLMPVWSSDNRIYFVSDRGGVDNIWTLRADQAVLAASGDAPAGDDGAVITSAPSDDDG